MLPRHAQAVTRKFFRPCPANSFCKIEWNDSRLEEIEVLLINFEGQLISKKIMKSGSNLPIQDLPTGLYIVHAMRQGIILASEKLIVIHE